MERILQLTVRISVGFSLFFLTLYLIVIAAKPINSPDTPMLTSSDVLMIGGMFVVVGLIAQISATASKFVCDRRASRWSVARLDDVTLA